MNTKGIFFLLIVQLFLARPAMAFCGFYVAKADTDLFNQASKVVLVRDEDRTVITMANDYQGDAKEFAIVIPVPVVLQKDQIHVGNRAVIDHIDAYTSPRLVEYYDGDPCQQIRREKMLDAMPSAALSMSEMAKKRARSLGVSIEAEYTVGEYDILILSARQSGGLQTWLEENDYKLPRGAGAVLQSYIRQDMKFFVARVNLKEQSRLGYSYLRPLQMAFESKKFMLPLRLGTLNAKAAQDLFVFALTRKGRVETTNYRTVKLPTGMELPEFVQKEFTAFYKDMFRTQVEKENKRAVFLEYAWDMNWCDPCAADPLSRQELQQLGVFWLDTADKNPAGATARNVFVTRLHVRYDAENFPDDLRFQTTGNRSNYQGRYVLRHPWKGEADCEHAREYFRQLRVRLEHQAQTLANLTGWDIGEIRDKIRKSGGELPEVADPEPWWRRIWK